MKPLKLFLVSFLFFIFANAAFAQSRLSGKVVEVLSARTVVVELQTGSRITTELQFIDTPDSTQALYQTVKDHLQNMVLNKVVEFRPKGMREGKAVGSIYLNGTDVALQMIRDGAARYAATEGGTQDASESNMYQVNEALAKSDKLGVWSPAYLKAEADSKVEKSIAAKKEVAPKEKVNKSENEIHLKPRLLGRAEMEQANTLVKIWPDVDRPKTSDSFSPFLLRPDIKPDFDGLYTISTPDQSFGAVVTPYHKIKVSDGKESYDSSVSLGRVYGNLLQSVMGIKDGDYVMVMLLASEKGLLSSSKTVSLTLTVGKEKFNLVSLPKFKRQVSEGVLEELAFKVDRSTLNKLAKAESIKLSFGKYSGSAEKPVIASVKSLKDREP